MTEVATIFDDETMEPIADIAGFLQFSVDEGADAYEYPVEDGTHRSDHIARKLSSIEVGLRLTGDVRSALRALHDAYMEHRKLAIQTQHRLFQSLIIVAFPYGEAVGDGDSATVQLSLREWREITPEYGELPPRKVAQPKNADTQDRGTVPAETNAAKEAEDTRKKKSILAGMFG